MVTLPGACFVHCGRRLERGQSAHCLRRPLRLEAVLVALLEMVVLVLGAGTGAQLLQHRGLHCLIYQLVWLQPSGKQRLLASLLLLVELQG